ncbi:MAG: phosphotransferase [Candidatus Margulisbacteria bacterium]|nr:phosphotransferase [Candidatus Margulisiibacteriota bacterium]
MKIYDRTVRGMLAAPQKAHLGRLADQRLFEKKRSIQTWIKELPPVEITDRSNRSFYPGLARDLERLLVMPRGSLQLEDKTFTSYRKKTQLTTVSFNGNPWLILKIFVDNTVAHSVLRAYNEAEGCESFSSIPGVVSPKLIVQAKLSGKAAPPYAILVGESVVSGISLLNWLELGAKKDGEERTAFIGRAEDLTRQCAEMIQRVHLDQPAPEDQKSILLPEVLEAEAVDILDKMESAVISREEAARIRRFLRCNRQFASRIYRVRAHRDFTTNNILFSDTYDTVGIIDLEKSGSEYPGKDISKFTESLVIDGPNIGLREEEADNLGETFKQAYWQSMSFPNFGNFLRMVKFYQVYTILSFIDYDLRDQFRANVLAARLRKVIAS